MTATAPSENERKLAAWERRMGPVIIAAALVPIVASLSHKGETDPFVLIDVASWLVFMADLVVHMRLRRRYLRTGIGVFDLVIVVLTFPWFLIPGLGNTAVLGLARLGRLLRVVLAGTSTKMVHRLVARLGKAGIYSALLMVLCAIVVQRVEPASSGFANFGDSMWWAIVTFTTVGYGDLVPVTGTGRLVAAFLMIGGIALIGLLAGSLSEMFTSPEERAQTDDPAADPGEATDEVAVELRALRQEIAELRTALAAPPVDE